MTGAAAGRLAAAVAAGALLIFSPAVAAQETGPRAPPPEELGKVIREIERLDALRSGLARSFLGTGGEVDRETFRNVCQPVGKELKSLAAENGWTVAQMAVRYRNPAHRADSVARAVMEEMERDRELMGTWRRARMDGREGVRYFRRITVERACLACHGAKEERPAFVREKYPEDRAHGFDVGDLRGVYSVFVPEQEPGGERPR